MPCMLQTNESPVCWPSSGNEFTASENGGKFSRPAPGDSELAGRLRLCDAAAKRSVCKRAPWGPEGTV